MAAEKVRLAKDNLLLKHCMYLAATNGRPLKDITKESTKADLSCAQLKLVLELLDATVEEGMPQEGMLAQLVQIEDDKFEAEELVLEPVKWNPDSENPNESLALRRLSMLISAYEVNFWWFELFEMSRKLVLISVRMHALWYPAVNGHKKGAHCCLRRGNLVPLGVVPCLLCCTDSDDDVQAVRRS